MRHRFRRATRRYATSTRRSYRHKSSTGSLVMTVGASMAYGALRNKLAQMAQPVTSKLPFGNYADEALLGFVGYMLAKKGNGLVKEIGRSALIIESASVGNQAAGEFTGSTYSPAGSGIGYNFI